MSHDNYIAKEDRYQNMVYARCGSSGLKLPQVSLGLWHNFGRDDDFQNAREICRSAFDNGVCHFDLANNYGPPYGSAESTFGKILASDFKSYRDQLTISTKAGYDMWPGPYGNGGSRKYLISSLDQSLKRMGLDYVDIFYSHRFDPETPLEETMMALDSIVRSGKALYVGISNYDPQNTQKASDILRKLGTPALIHQFKYSMLQTSPENGLLEVLEKNSLGGIAFSPLAQGLLTSKYLGQIPLDSRMLKDGRFLKPEHLKPDLLDKLLKLNNIAQQRQQSLAQMALAWVLRKKEVTSVLIGASRSSQIIESIKSLENLYFSEFELRSIDQILKA